MTLLEQRTLIATLEEKNRLLEKENAEMKIKVRNEFETKLAELNERIQHGQKEKKDLES